MTRGDNPRISLLRTWSKAHDSDLHTFQHALDQILSFFCVILFFASVELKDWNCRRIKVNICSCQSWEIRAGTDFCGGSICFTSFQEKEKKNAGHQFIFTKIGCFLGISLLEMLTCADSPSKSCRKHLKQLRYKWIHLFLGTFMSRKVQNTWPALLL